jgi:hypothetical protein
MPKLQGDLDLPAPPTNLLSELNFPRFPRPVLLGKVERVPGQVRCPCAALTQATWFSTVSIVVGQILSESAAGCWALPPAWVVGRGQMDLMAARKGIAADWTEYLEAAKVEILRGASRAFR